jgi:UDP-N-acetylglucosamine acyltransferase
MFRMLRERGTATVDTPQRPSSRPRTQDRQSHPALLHERTHVSQIHPTAVIEAGAQLGENVTIGPFCVVESGAVIGDGCKLAARVVVKSRTTLGVNNDISEGAVIGARAQHAIDTNPGGILTIGDNNRIRENATLHRGYANDAATVVGSNNLIMVNAHVGHDCQVGNNCIIVNGAMLGGHVTVEDRAYISGGVAIHQFCRVGRFAMIGGLAKIVQDVPPYVTIEGGGVTEVVGLNRVGLRRNGFTPEEVQQLKQAYRVIYRQGLRWSEVLQILKTDFSTGPAAAFHEFFKSGKRGFVQERRISRKATLRIVNADTDDIESDDRSKRSAA